MEIDSPDSKAQLEEALDKLITGAHENGVNVGNGGYELIHEEESIPNWDLTIIEMS